MLFSVIKFHVFPRVRVCPKNQKRMSEKKMLGFSPMLFVGSLYALFLFFLSLALKNRNKNIRGVEGLPACDVHWFLALFGG
jgi:hypothetical protein